MSSLHFPVLVWMRRPSLAHVLVLAVVDPVVAGEVAEPVPVELGSLRYDGRFIRNVGVDDGDNLVHGAAGHVIAANASAALHKGQETFLWAAFVIRLVVWSL